MRSHLLDSSMLKDFTAETERRYHELLVLSKISNTLSGSSDLETMLKMALDDILGIMNGSIGGILLLDEKTQTLKYHIYKGRTSRLVDELRFRLGEGIVGRVAQSGEPMLLEDIATDARIVYPAIIAAERLRAFVAVPLQSKGKVLGVLNVVSHTARSFTDSDTHLLCSIGNQLGVAIERVRLTERLRRSRERLRKLARQNLVVEEEERRRIARELHDETSQTLSGLTLQLQVLIDVTTISGIEGPELIARLKDLQSMSIQVHSEINRLIADLRPALLDTLGLIPAIRQYADSKLQFLGMNVSVQTKGMTTRLSDEVEAGVFRFVQGAIGNVAKHSKANNVKVFLNYQPTEFHVKISDDGIGFDVSQITDVEENGRGRGLFSMRERIGFLGGTSGVESRTGKGTKVWAKIPLWRE